MFRPLLPTLFFITGSLFASEVTADPMMNFEFDGKVNGPGPEWAAVNDGVMGGLSKGGPTIEDGVMVFRGVLSLANNGGFSSVRYNGGPRDLSTAIGINLRVRGDGRTYQLRLATDARFNGSPVSYSADILTTAGEWSEVHIPFSAMKPRWRGRLLDGPPLNLSNVEEIGILLGDKKAGEFKLEIDWLKAVATE